MRDALVIPAWEVASSNTAIKVFNFLPSLLSTIYLSLILLYQVAWSSISLFGGKDIFFKMVVDFVHASYFFEVAIVAVVFLFLYLLITPIAEGGLVALIDRADRGDALAGSAGFGITRGLKFFLPIFEASNITALFKLLSIITFSLFLVRLFGIENI